ncbi:MAG TPA: hypothetical protein VGE29_20835 [Prosthecobacter sp.]
MSSHVLFVEAVRATTSLPALLRGRAEDVSALEEHRFDEPYIGFLDTQIRLSPRGSEWTGQLIRRRAALLPFCGITLLRGRVTAGDVDFTVEIDPKTGTVIHWDEYSTVDSPS